MHTKSNSLSRSVNDSQAYCPLAYNGVQHGPSSNEQRRLSARDSISTTYSHSSSLASIDSRGESTQNSYGSHETKRKLKTGFLKPAHTAQLDFLVEKFKHRKEASKEGLTAANLKALESNQ